MTNLPPIDGEMIRLRVKKAFEPWTPGGIPLGSRAYMPRWGKADWWGMSEVWVLRRGDKEWRTWSFRLQVFWEHFEAIPIPVREMRNPYTCRLLRRLDAWIYAAMGKTVKWSDGALCFVGHNGVRWQAPSLFPGWMYRAAAAIQNRWWWTRNILSY